jgi:four helix bundle protein
MLKSYKDLSVWQKAYQFCKDIYKATKQFPSEEKYELSSQIRKSAISVPSNIAEGYGRGTTREYLHSLFIAYGSLCEMETQLLLSGDLGFIPNGTLGTLLQDHGDIERMLKGLIKSLERKVSVKGD